MAYQNDLPSRRESEQLSARANLLAGLRTSGAREAQPHQSRQGSPAFLQQQEALLQQQRQLEQARQLTANSPVFVPGLRNGNTPPDVQSADYMGALENHFAALQMSAMHSTPNIAASYGAAQGQPHHQQMQQRQQQRYQQQQHPHSDDYVNQQAVNEFLRQRAAQQEYQQHRLHAQALAAQQRREASVANNKQALFASIEAEYQRALEEREQQRRSAAAIANSAHMQRQAAQASIQANIRTRQIEQLYAELLEEEQQGRLDRRVLGGRDLYQVAQDAVDEQHFAEQQQRHRSNEAQVEEIRERQLREWVVQMQQVRQEASQSIASQQSAQQHLSAPQPQQQQQKQSRERVPSHADKAKDWRSRSATPSASTETTGSAGEGDSTASTSPRSSRSFNSADDTPRTSEEDVGGAATVAAGPEVGAKQSQMLAPNRNTRFGSGIGRGPPPSSTSMSSLTTAAPQLANKPQSRAFSLAASGRNTTGPAGSKQKQPSRQPRGPPTDIEAVNFASRKNARTRKEALSKLRACSSPRMATSPVIT